MVKIFHHISALQANVVYAAVCSNAVVMLLLIQCLLLLPLFAWFGFWSMSCYAVLSVQSSFSIISLRKRECVALL